MVDSSCPLPDDVDALKRMVAVMEATVAAQAEQIRTLETGLQARQLLIENLQIQIAALRRHQYGRKSEKMETEVG